MRGYNFALDLPPTSLDEFGLGRSGRWNSHAISDIRVNEFRELRALDNKIDMDKVVNFPRVDGFLIASANYKAGRQSPQPKYVRILENKVSSPSGGGDGGRTRR